MSEKDYLEKRSKVKDKPKVVEIKKEILDTTPLSKDEKKDVKQGLKDIVEEKIFSHDEVKEVVEEKPKKKDKRKNNRGRPKKIPLESKYYGGKLELIENKKSFPKKYIALFIVAGLVVLIYWKRDYIKSLGDKILLKWIERKEREISKEGT